MTSRPESLNGVEIAASLTVNDIHASLAWYCDVVGFTIGQKFEREGRLRAVSLRAGAVSLLIGQDDFAKGHDRVKGQGFSLQITTAQNIDEVANRIRANGGSLALEPTDTRWGSRTFSVRDPDGFTLVISSAR